MATQPQSQTKSVGNTATFSVSANGDAPFLYFWYKNNVQISGANSSSYTTPTLSISDNGNTYKCIITNCNSTYQAISSNATLTVENADIAVSVATHPSNQTVNEGNTATFSVTVNGTAPFSYFWYKNGTLISGANSSSYTTPTLTTSDNGNHYYCLITNNNNTNQAQSNNATLTVSSICTPISMGSQPSNKTITPGTTVTFNVSANGTAPFSYFWYKNGSQISGANSSSYTTPTLTVSDNGNYYYCHIFNCNGNYQVISNYAYLTLATIQNTVITSSIPSYGGTTSGSGTYSYNEYVTVKASPNLNYKFVNWTKNGIQVSNNASYSFNIVDNENLVANFSLTNTPNIYLDKLSITLYETNKKSAILSFNNSYKVSENDLLSDKNNTGLASRVIVPLSVTENWKKNMLEKYGDNNSLPNFVDWSTYDSPVKNQNPCGSCWAFSAIALLENLANQNRLLPNPDFSEQEMVSCVPNNNCSGGWYYEAFNYIKNNGLLSENCFPYVAKNTLCANQCANPEGVISISQFSNALWNYTTVDDLKLALQDGPLSVAMFYQTSFFSYKGGIIKSNNTEAFHWGHAVLLVGYDDNLQCFKVKNSYGSGWGEKGYFRISYSDVTSNLKFGSYASFAKGISLANSNNIVSETFTINNLGGANLIINNITSDKEWLSVSLPSGTVLPSSSISVKISLSNWNLISGSTETAKVTINSNDPVDPIRYITVIAQKSVNSTIPQLLVSTDFYKDKELPVASSSIPINVGIIGQGTINWNGLTSDNWITLSNPNGQNNGLITANCSVNNTGKSRTGYVTISSASVSNSPQVVAITQSSNNAPIISNINKATKNKTDPVYFASSDFINHFVDIDGNTLKYIMIESFPANGSLELYNYPIVAKQTIPENDIRNIAFIPNSSWNGNLTFEYNASDGTNYAANTAFVNSYITGISDKELLNNIIIYPNPTSDKFYVEFDLSYSNRQITISLYNLIGQKVQVERIADAKLGKIKSTLDVKNLANGIYQIQIKLDNETIINRKVVIQK
ncbi:MAG: C1 family peptidase [Bacteroidota bacterium]|nr:C1 family peptidase [Bacteroidota bacterium]